MNQWLNQYIQPLSMVLGRMRQNLLGSILICCVIGLTLSLPTILFTIIDNLGQVTGNLENRPQLNLFLKLDISNSTKEAISEQLKKHPGINKYEFVSKENAWEQMQQNASTAEISATLNKNPLPDAFFVTPKDIKPENLQRLQKEMQQWDGVESAQVDANWIKRLDTVIKLGKKVIFVLVILLGIALITIIGNTIRLQIMTQLEEIEVSKLIGATNQFIRRPFLYAGTLYGLGGGLAGLLVVYAVVQLFNTSVTEIADLYASQFRLSMPNANIIGAMLLSAIGLGWMGSFVAVNRALAKIDQV
jgi:cell division transport system permease protein